MMIKDYIKEGSVVIDGTAGNGNDTLFMANLVGDQGQVYSFDVQELAINNTKKLLEKNSLFHRVNLINDTHTNIGCHVKSNVDVAVFNLGYLPRGDRNVITKYDTTVMALKEVIKLMHKNSILVITSYYGHEGGVEERNSVESFVNKLNNKEFCCTKIDFINKPNNPPIIYHVEKLSD